MPNKYIRKFIRYAVILLSFGIGFIMLVVDCPREGYEWYGVVPILFAIMTLLCGSFSFCEYKKIGVFVLQLSMICRYVITPIIGHFGGYHSIFGTSVTKKEIEMAVLLTVYEMIFVFVISEYQSRMWKHKVCGIINKSGGENRIEPLRGSIFHIGIILLGIAAVIFQPLTISDQRFLFNQNNLALNIRVDFPLAGIYKTAFNFARYSVILLVINLCFKRNKKHRSIENIVLPILVIAVNALFNSNLSRIGLLVPIITFSVVMLRVFSEKKQRRTLMLIVGCGLIGGLIFLSFVKFFGEGRGDTSNSTDLSWWSDTLNMYFMGIKEIALGVKATSRVEAVYGWFRLPLIFNDIFSQVVGLSNFTNTDINSTTLYNLTYFGSSISKSQICPNICEGLYYFGGFFAPLWTGVFVWLTHWFTNRISEQKYIDSMFVYTISAVYCGMCLMINSCMIIYAIVNISLLYGVIAYLNKKIVLRR